MNNKWIFAFLFLLALAGASFAATPACGSTISANTVFDADMDCPSTTYFALDFDTSGISLDCAGFDINVNGSQYGLLVDGISDINISNCAISNATYAILINYTTSVNITNTTTSNTTLDSVTLDNVNFSYILNSSFSYASPAHDLYALRFASVQSSFISNTTLIDSSGSTGGGLYMTTSSYNVIENSTIRGRYALELLGTWNNVSNSTIISPSNAIYFASHNNIIRNSSLQGALSFVSSSIGNIIDNCTVTTVTAGASSANNFSNSFTGAITLGAGSNAFRFVNVTVKTTTHGVTINGQGAQGNHLFINSSIDSTGADFSDIYIYNDAINNVFLNTTFDRDNVSFGAQSIANELSVQWFVDVSVVNSTDQPEGDVSVNATPSTGYGGNSVFNGSTNASGNTSVFNLTEFNATGPYIYNGIDQGNVTFFNNYTFYANKTSYITNYTNETVNQSKTIRIILAHTGITDCGTITHVNGVLLNNISATGTCFEIGADNVTLDCAGYTITGDGTGYGVRSYGRTGTRVINCNLFGFQTGILYTQTNNSLMLNNSANSTARGYWINDTLISVIANSTSVSPEGIWLVDSNAITAENLTTISHNDTVSMYGFYIETLTNSTIKNCTIDVYNTSAGDAYGIYMAPSTYLTIENLRMSVDEAAYLSGIYDEANYSNYTDITVKIIGRAGSDAHEGITIKGNFNNLHNINVTYENMTADIFAWGLISLYGGSQNNTMSNMTLFSTGWSNGITFMGDTDRGTSNNTIINTSIIMLDSPYPDINFSYTSSQNRIWNSTFNRSNVYVVWYHSTQNPVYAKESNLSVGWWKDVYVRYDDGTPCDGCSVILSNSTGGVQYNLLTDASGYVRMINVTEFFANGTYIYNQVSQINYTVFNPYTITANSSISLKNSTTINITDSTPITLTLLYDVPVLFLNEPSNRSYYTTFIPYSFNITNSTIPSFHCWQHIDGVVTDLGNITTNEGYNSTLSLNITSHIVNVTCLNARDINMSKSVYFTIDLYRFNATSFLDPLFETNTTPYDLNISANTFVTSVIPTLQFNGTNYTIISTFNVSDQYYFVRNQSAPLLLTNNSLVNHTWYATFVLANGTNITMNITNASQTVYFAYGIENVTSNQTFAVEGEILEFSMNFWNILNNATLNASGRYWNPNVTGFKLTNASYIEWNGTTQVLGVPETNISAYAVIAFEGISRAVMSTNQTITTGIINISLCGAAPFNVPFLRYFHRDEENQSIVNGSNEVTFTVWNTDRTLGRNYSFTVNNDDNWTVCFLPNYGSFLVDSFHEYTATPESNNTRNTYSGRTHFLRNAIVTNETSNITLYSLNTTWSDLVRITVREALDRSLSRNTVIQIKRYFPGNGTYRTVSMILTGTDGIGETWLRAEDAFEIPFYTFSFIRDDCTPTCSSGDIQNRSQIVADRSGNYELTLYLPFDPVDRQYFYRNLVATCVANATEVSCRFTDTTGLARHWNLTLDIWTIGNYSGLLRDCNNYSYGDTVLLTCALSANRSYMYQGWITINDEPFIWFASGYNNTMPFDWGRDALFAMLLLFVVVTLAGVRNPGTYGILAIVSLIGGLAIGIIYLDAGIGWELMSIGLIMIVGFYLYRSRT